MDAETLTFLLAYGHLNMEERIKRGLWPHPPLKFDDVVRHLAGVVKAGRRFPPAWRPAAPGEAVFEGGSIERRSLFRYVYRWQYASPLSPYVLRQQGERVFWSAEAAARHYLKSDLHLPGDLDSWKVIP